MEEPLALVAVERQRVPLLLGRLHAFGDDALAQCA
jgi:hypothetical protein